jgi:hypothetical protein
MHAFGLEECNPYDKTEDESWYVFNDMHAAMAYFATGRLDHLRALVAGLRDHRSVQRPNVANAAMTADVGLPVCDGILAFGEARYDHTVALLLPIRKVVHRFGGSNAQRDAVARTLLEAAIRAGHHTLAEALVSERLALRDTSPYNRRQVARIPRTAAPHWRADADRTLAATASTTATQGDETWLARPSSA